MGKTGRLKLNSIPSASCDLAQCFKDHKLMEKKTDYTLKTGDTIQGLADQESIQGNAIEWQDIAAFNWGDEARDKKHCKFMRDELGCFEYDSNLGFMAYKENGKPHTLEIPQIVSKKGQEFRR